MLPTVKAEEVTEYDLWVAGVPFTSGNLVIDHSDNEDITSGSAEYDLDTNTLTLIDFKYTGDGHRGDDTYGYGVYEAAIFSGHSLNLKLVGNSEIVHDNGNNANYSCGIFSDGELIISDDDGDTNIGTLTVTGGNGASETSGGIIASADVVINIISVTIV